MTSRLNAVAEQANRAIEQYRYHEYAQLLWHFFWHEFCDWYIELKKVPGAATDHATRALETALRLLHPAMPFLTEELWQRLRPVTDQVVDKLAPPTPAKSIALAPFPQFTPELADPEAEKEIAVIQKIVTKIRTIRAFAAIDSNAHVGPKHQLIGSFRFSERFAGPVSS